MINQIEAVLEYERTIIEYLKAASGDELNENKQWIQLSGGYDKKRRLLIEQVNELRKIDYNIECVYMKNSELELEDSKL